jgi:hypothetical protein
LLTPEADGGGSCSCDKMSNHLRKQNAVSVRIIFPAHEPAPITRDPFQTLEHSDSRIFRRCNINTDQAGLPLA